MCVYPHFLTFSRTKHTTSRQRGQHLSQGMLSMGGDTGEEALTYWDQMIVDGMAGNVLAYVSLLNAWAIVTTQLRGQNSHFEI